MADQKAETPRDLEAAVFSKPVSIKLLAGLLRIFDLSVISFLAASIYFAYVHPEYTGFAELYFTSTIIAIVLAGVVFQWFQLYAQDYFLSARPRLGRVLLAWTIIFGVLLTFAFALKLSTSFSRVWAVSWYLSTAGGLIAGRLVFSIWVRRWTREGRLSLRTVIVGVGKQGVRLMEHLQEFGDPQIRILGFVDDRKNSQETHIGDITLLGTTDDLIRMIREDRVDQVFVALPWSEEERLRDLVYRLAVTPVSIRLAPDMVGFEFIDREFSQVARLAMLHLFDRPISGWAYATKMLEDYLLAALALVILSPLLLIIAAVIKLTSSGPVFFKQKRYGFNDQLFEVWKFRSMYEEAEPVPELVQAKKQDPRITPFGKFLRRSSLDELPQIFNVLLGDMSIVGPRPHAVATLAADDRFEEVVDRYAARHRVKPGITGWAQVNGWRGETDTFEKIQKRVEFDIFYIDNWSIWLDMRIIARTLLVIFTDKNAY
jgi:Undecaprenyl-phosphate glucose phosphotransferase